MIILKEEIKRMYFKKKKSWLFFYMLVDRNAGDFFRKIIDLFFTTENKIFIYPFPSEQLPRNLPYC